MIPKLWSLEACAILESKWVCGKCVRL